MCGTSEEQTNISSEQAQFYKTLTDQYSTIFGQNQAIVGALTSQFQPILAAGPSQTGFSQSQENALRTQNVENTATDYAQAQRATAQILAARGGGNTLLPSSVDANLLAQNTAAAAAQRSAGDLAITNANYAQGYQNWNTAANVLGSTAQLINPNAYAGSTTTAGNAAYTSAYQNAQTAFQPWGAAFNVLGNVAGMASGAATRKWLGP
jgi:hypothetical protein